MSEMHELIIDSTTKILKDYCTKELIDEADAGTFPSDLWQVLVESGMTAVAVSDNVGGTGGDFHDAFQILRLAGKYAAPIPLAETLIVNWLLAEQGVEPTSEPRTFLVDETNDLQVKQVDKGFYIDGTLNHVPKAKEAKEILVMVEVNNEPFITLLPLEEANIDERQNLAGESLNQVIYQEVIVDQLTLYPVNREEMIEKISNMAGLGKAAMMSGAMERILELTVQYTKEREQFGRPLHRLQAIQQHLAVLAGETVVVTSAVNQAIAVFNDGQIVEEIATAKIRANMAVKKMTEIAHQVHGAIGATHEHALHQFTRRLWAWREEAGNENEWQEKLARMMMAEEGSIWGMITAQSEKELIN